MKASHLKLAIKRCLKENQPLLIAGPPGTGKSDIEEQSAKEEGYDNNIVHPITYDPTDFKGLPFEDHGEAKFLPFSVMKLMIEATKPTVIFIDDFGHATAAVQAAVMQPILARKINGFNISENIRFIAATNRVKDKAGVNSILEPIKSRFLIVELEADLDDWCEWAIKHDMPHELISFIRFRPELLHKYEPTKELINSPCPRTIAKLGKMQAHGIESEIQYDIFSGLVGEGFTVEYTAFMKLFSDLPTYEQILVAPDKADFKYRADVMYAITGLISNRFQMKDVKPIMKFIDRIPVEFQVVTMKQILIKTPDIKKSAEFVTWAVKNANQII